MWKALHGSFIDSLEWRGWSGLPPFVKTDTSKIFFCQPYALLLLLRLNNTFMQTFDLKPIATHWDMGKSGQHSRNCSPGPSVGWQWRFSIQACSPAASLQGSLSPSSSSIAPNVTTRSLLKHIIWSVASGWRKAFKEKRQ